MWTQRHCSVIGFENLLAPEFYWHLGHLLESQTTSFCWPSRWYPIIRNLSPATFSRFAFTQLDYVPSFLAIPSPIANRLQLDHKLVPSSAVYPPLQDHLRKGLRRRLALSQSVSVQPIDPLNLVDANYQLVSEVVVVHCQQANLHKVSCHVTA